MPGLSLKDCIDWLRRELPPESNRYKVYDDLPFAILVYDPGDEWKLRKEVRHLTVHLTKAGLEVVTISLAELMWKAIVENEGLDVLAALERERGFEVAQEQVNLYLDDKDFTPLPELLADRMRELDPQRHICFLTRAAALGPDIYHLSILLEQMQGRLANPIPAVLFYPGKLVDTNTLRFMDLPDRDALGSYRVKIYG